MTVYHHQLTNRPWSSIDQYLRSKYQVIAEIDFLEVDYAPDQLFYQLAKHYKNTYLPHEKIIVYHYDTDYYVNGIGFTLHNFLRCLKFLNISPSVVIMITNHHGIEKEIKSFYATHYVDFDYHHDHIKLLESNHNNLQTTPDPEPTELDVQHIGQPFVCMFGIKRTHRVALHSTLAHQRTLEKGICSWNSANRKPLPRPPVFGQTSNTAMPEFLTVTPLIRVNEHWPMNQQLISNYKNFEHLYDTPYCHPDIVGPINENRFCQPAVKKALLYVSTETVFEYPYPYITEKTFRAILHKRPFVILGATGSLKFLKSVGFKTFDSYWNEDYDDTQDPSQRIFMIADIIGKISNMSIAQQQEMCYNMRDILEHNFNHYVSNYINIDLHNKLTNIK